MHFGKLSAEGKERAARAVRRRWQLHVPKPKEVDSSSQSTPLGRCLEPRVDGRCAEPACPYPRSAGAFCRQHSRDQIAENSPVGTAHSLLRDFGLVTASDSDESAERRRCRKSARVAH